MGCRQGPARPAPPWVTLTVMTAIIVSVEPFASLRRLSTMKPVAELTAYLEGLSEPHIVFDVHYRILAANAAYRRRFSPQQSVVGRHCYEVSHHFGVPCDQAGESCPMAAARRSGARERVLHLHHTPHGEEYVNIELTPLPDPQGEPAFYVEKMEPLRRSEAAADPLVGRSAAFQATLALVARVAPSRASVLLLGESGTGKELIARAVHDASPRASKAFVPVDCSSLPETLFESELFGHERGAYTGATAAKAGLVEAASGGTLFLDEVGDIPLAMQVKLLRLLETGTYRRVGSTELRHADIRVVAATHRDLAAMVREGRFREDLYYRLAIFPISLPPLRVRRDDIPLLAEALLRRLAAPRPMQLSVAALRLLQQHDYPGNVRELRNLLERAVLLGNGDIIDETQVRQALALGAAAPPPVAPAVMAAVADVTAPSPIPPDPSAAAPLQAWERQALQAALARHQGSRAELARQLGISERTLYRKLRRLGLGGRA